MHEGIYIAASGGLKQQKQLDVIANNLANVNSSAFKADRLVFQEMIPPFKEGTSFENARSILMPPGESNENVAYVGVAELFTDHSSGPLVQTGNSLDLALEGEGYFKIETPDGMRYTRNGQFRLNAGGQLVTHEGNKVLGLNDRAIEIDPRLGNVSIDPTGTVSVGKGLENVPVGKLQLIDLPNKDALSKDGNGLVRISNPDVFEEVAKDVSVRQGFLENSNVNTMDEMSRMITTLRAYEAYQKVIQAIDSADEQSITHIGRVA